MEPQPAQDHEIAAAGGIADVEADVGFLRGYIDRALWRKDVPDNMVDELLILVFGEDGRG